jgi:hypothetical protein
VRRPRVVYLFHWFFAFVPLVAVTAGTVLRFIYFNGGSGYTTGLVLMDGGVVLAALVVGQRALEVQTSTTALSLRLAGLLCFVSFAALSSAFILRHLGLLTLGIDAFYSAMAGLVIVCLTTLLWPGFFSRGWRWPWRRQRKLGSPPASS